MAQGVRPKALGHANVPDVFLKPFALSLDPVSYVTTSREANRCRLEKMGMTGYASITAWASSVSKKDIHIPWAIVATWLRQ